MGRFNFTGKLRINAMDAKYPSFKNGKTKKGTPYKSTVLFVAPTENNSGVVELFGQKTNEVDSIDNDNNKFSFSWDERNEKEIVDKVAGYRKNVISIDDNRKQFTTSYDAVEYLEENADELKGRVVTVTGRTRKSEYNGKISEKYDIQNIYTVAEDKKPGLNISTTIYFNKESFDFADWKESSRINVSAYTKEWMDAEHPSVYVSQLFIIDCSKVNFEDENHVKKANATFGQLGLSFEDGKPKCTLKANRYYSMAVLVRMLNGAAIEEMSLDLLTPLQRQQVELGIRELKDFAAKGNVYGNRVLEYKIYACDLSAKDYEDGMIMLDEKASEFESDIYAVSEPKNDNDSSEDIGMNKPTSDSNDEEDDSLADLFD